MGRSVVGGLAIGAPAAARRLTPPLSQPHPLQWIAMTSDTAATHAGLRERLRALGLRDEAALRRGLDRARAQKDPGRRADALARLAEEVAAAEQRLAARAATVPAVTYPPELPVSQARDELAAVIRDHQVVVVAGETGSGKTTQLPKVCLELGRGVRGAIGHTQPRRIAARAVAERIAVELDVELGQQVGYQVRFTDRASDATLVKVMTDGILLAEIQSDPQLRAYDTIIVDEAHERSLTIDFLLGYLGQLLPRRPDLKVIITSATIDPERFAAHFGGAPIVEVSGRTYPVELRYRPLGEDEDQIAGIVGAIRELAAERPAWPTAGSPGDVLVFLSGEREIRDTADALAELGLRDTEIQPLYARLSAADQHRVFAPHRGRRIVLATNIAETSLTVPGIRYVVDPGFARISRYGKRSRVQRLPIEKISQASANQRAGRCGRVADGICIRLYDEDDFADRPAFTEPEILRTNLAAVVLRMAALGLGDVDAFPFVDPPDRRAVRDAVALLHELGAVEDDDPDVPPRLTPIGRRLARLPIDPRIGRMLLEGDRNGCLREVLVIAAALSIQDPRERPVGAEAEADAAHARFADEDSDFLAWLHLWEHVRGLQRELGSSAFRRRCRAEFLHHLRIREWQDLHAQLRTITRELGLHRNVEPQPHTEAIHRALLTGLLSQVGMREADAQAGRGSRSALEYAGARGTRFALWPGSGLARKPPAWVMAAELVETARLWGRTVARIDPDWVEAAAPHLVQRTHSDPRWVRRRGAAVATERVTLFGLPLVAGRTVPLQRVDPASARELFIRHALVEGQWQAPHAFLRDNARLYAEVAEVEERTRRRDLVVDEEALVAFYAARVPATVVSGRHFDAWWKRARTRHPELLTLTREDLLRAAGAELDPAEYPDVWRQGPHELRLSYRFEPGAPDDGVTVDVPLPLLTQVSADGFDWQVPGLRAELVTALVRALPKDLRRPLVPIPDTVDRVLPRLHAAVGRSPLAVALATELQREAGVAVPPEAFDLDRVPEHLRVTFRVVDGRRILGLGKDLAELRRAHAGAVRVAVADTAGAEVERRGQRAWTFGTLPRTVERMHGGHPVVGYPALVDEGETVGVRVLLSEREQAQAMWAGTRRLLQLALPPPARAVHARLGNTAKLALSRSPHGSVPALLADCTAAAIDDLLARHGGPAWDAEGFAVLQAAIAADLEPVVVETAGRVAEVLEAAGAAERALDRRPAPAALQASLDDARTQLAGLVRPGFVAAAGRTRLADLVRYLQALTHRVERLSGTTVARDRMLMEEVAEVQSAYDALLAARRATGIDERVRAIRWQIEELRVGLFAQQLGTRERVSTARILRAIASA
jgi:ATP-dependent helicase HrpA